MEGKNKMEEEVSRIKILTLNVYLMSMLLLEYLEELQYLPVWAMAIKNNGKKFVKSLEHKIVSEQIDRVYKQSPEDHNYMINRFEKLTKLISSTDPQELDDFIDMVDQYKNNKEEFLKYFNIVRNEN